MKLALFASRFLDISDITFQRFSSFSNSGINISVAPWAAVFTDVFQPEGLQSYQKETPTQLLCCEYCKLFKNSPRSWQDITCTNDFAKPNVIAQCQEMKWRRGWSEEVDDQIVFQQQDEIICFNLASQMVEESDRNEFNLVANFFQS